jgi:hypothetical protein
VRAERNAPRASLRAAMIASISHPTPLIAEPARRRANRRSYARAENASSAAERVSRPATDRAWTSPRLRRAAVNAGRSARLRREGSPPAVAVYAASRARLR